MAAKADLGKAGGIIAFTAGVLQVLTSYILIGVVSAIGRMFRDYDSPGTLFALVPAFVTVFFGAMLISGARPRMPGIVLIVCALVIAFFGAPFAALAVLTLLGGVIALIGGFGGGTGSGVRNMVATAQRMAKAAQETDPAVPKE